MNLLVLLNSNNIIRFSPCCVFLWGGTYSYYEILFFWQPILILKGPPNTPSVVIVTLVVLTLVSKASICHSLIGQSNIY